MTAKVSGAPKADQTLTRVEGEAWLLRRLLKHGIDALAGVTEEGERKTRFRQAIKTAGISEVICASKERKPLSYAQAFERLYGEKL